MDLAVVDAAVRYLTRQQRKNGAFPRIGKVHNYQLLVSHYTLQFTLLYNYICSYWKLVILYLLPSHAGI